MPLPWKPDFVRKLRRRPGNSSPNPAITPHPSVSISTLATPSANASSSQITILPGQQGRSFQDLVFEKLESKERETIQKYQVHSSGAIATTVDEAYNAALGQKRVCEDNRWRYEFRGRDVILADEADKVVHWLERFKSVGDVVANVDPIHVGLPWAGIRVILEIAVAGSKQMAALLVGMNCAGYMASRLSVYFDYYTRLPQVPATANFEKALIELYTLVLRFLAAAIQAYQKRGLASALQELWEPSYLDQFETKCKEWAIQVEIDASNCDRELSKRFRDNARGWNEELEKNLRKLDMGKEIKESLALMEDKSYLRRLPTAAGAAYDSFDDREFSRCLKGTRSQLIHQIVNWANDSRSKRILWLCGMAGTGKSTIARTVAHTFDKEQNGLGASFFFKRGEGDRGHAKRFFPTIAAQLAIKIPGLGHSIAKALDSDPLLYEKNLKHQFDNLVSQPLQDVVQPQAVQSGLVVVVDALDECENDQDIKTVLKLLPKLEAIKSFQIRIFVTSRPELPIRLGFKGMSEGLHQDVILEQVPATTIRDDIRAYLEHRFEEIRTEDMKEQSYDPIPTDWPGEDTIQALVDRAVPLFIFASTICLYISGSNPRKRLAVIMQQQQNVPTTGLAKTYLPILDQLVLGETSEQRQEIIANFQGLVGPIILLADPLSAISLERLLKIPLSDIDEILRPLHSVLNIPKDCNSPIRLLHLSFRDFLVDPKIKDQTRFWIAKAETHAKLAKQCLHLLTCPGILKKDVCGVDDPGARRDNISKQTVESSIAPDVIYACCYWVFHLAENEEKLCDDGQVHDFLQTHFLHWMEVMSWLGRLSSMVAYLKTLQDLVHVEQGVQLLPFLNDARRFVLRNRHVVELAPLQLYHSALIFTPAESIVRRCFEDKHSMQWPRRLPLMPSEWSPEIQKLEGHDGFVIAVAFSPNGLLASASQDHTIRLWDAATGKEIQKLEGHSTSVVAVAFSSSQVLASASFDKTIRIWDITTGEEIQKSKEYDDYIHAVAFSPDGKVLASADEMVRLWDTTTDKEIQLEGLTHDVAAVAFSPDGTMLASASNDRTVRLWDVTTGEEMQKLEGHDGGVLGVAFSPDGNVLASASLDHTIRLWDMTTVRLWNTTKVKEMQKLIGHGSDVRAIAFSLNGKMLASASNDRTVRLWDATTGEEMQKLEGHDGGVLGVAFSPDGNVLASASLDHTIRLWDMTTVRLWDTTKVKDIQKSKGHDDTVTAVVLSPDGKMLASASSDRTVKLWDTITGVEIRNLEGHNDAVTTIAFSPDGKVLASAGYEPNVILWDTTGGKILELVGHRYWVTTVAFSPDGKVLASAGHDRKVILWDTTGKKLLELRGHDDWVTAVVFSHDGMLLASADENKGNLVRLWNTTTGEEMQTLGIDRGQASFSSDGKTLITTPGNFTSVLRPSSLPAGEPQQSSDLSLDDHWIQYRGANLLWLPHEYRGTSRTCWDSRGNMLVIGQASGAVSFFECDMSIP